MGYRVRHDDGKAEGPTYCNAYTSIQAYSPHHSGVQAHVGFYKETIQFNSVYFYSIVHNANHFKAALQKRLDLMIQRHYLSIIRSYYDIHKFEILKCQLSQYKITVWISKE